MLNGMLLVLGIVFSGQAFGADRASEFVGDTMARAKEVLEIKEQADRTARMCALLSEKIGSDHIAGVWLGAYAQLTRDQAAVREFTGLVPSIMMSKALPVLGAGGSNGTFTVDAASKDRGNGIYEVGVTVTSNGRDYKGFAIVRELASGFHLIDVEYMGFSAVDYQGREYQKFLEREYNKDTNTSLPVTRLVELIISQDDYVACP